MSKHCRLQTGKLFENLGSKAQADIADALDVVVAELRDQGADVREGLENFLAKRRTDINTSKYQALSQKNILNDTFEIFDEKAFKDKPDKAIGALLDAQSGTRFKGKGNLWNGRSAAENSSISPVLKKIKELDLDKATQSPDSNLDMMKAMYGEVEGLDNRFVKLGESIKKMWSEIYDAKVDAAFAVKKIRNYMGRRRHPPKAMLELGEGPWKKLANDEFVIEGMGPVQKADFINKMWDNQSKKAGQPFWVEDDLSEDFTQVIQNFSKRKMESGRVINFKNAEGEHRYMSKMFPNKSFMAMTIDAVRAESGDIVAAKMFGVNYKLGFKQALKKAIDINPDRMSMDKVAILRDRFETAIKGNQDSPKNLIGKSVDKIKKLEDMTKLQASLVSTLPDFSIGAGVVSGVTGDNYLQVSGKIFTDTIKIMSSREAKMEVAAATETFALDILGFERSNRFTETGPIANGYDKMHHTFMKYTGIPNQAVSIKLAISKYVTTAVNKQSQLDFNSMDRNLRDFMKTVGIDEQDWSRLKHATGQYGDGTTGIITEKIHDLSDKLFGKGDKSLQKRKLAFKYNQFLTQIAERGSPTPGLNQAALRKTYSINTPVGAMLNLAMQYKSFILSQNESLKTLVQYGDPKVFGYTLASTAATGYMAIAAKDMLKGREVSDPKDPATWTRVGLQSGLGLIYADMLTAEYNKPWRNFTTDMMGPAAGTANDIGELWAGTLRFAIAKGRGESTAGTITAKQVKGKMNRLIPAPIPFVGPRIKKAMFEHMFDVLNK